MFESTPVYRFKEAVEKFVAQNFLFFEEINDEIVDTILEQEKNKKLF